MGSTDLLLPPGITDLREVPYNYFEAIGMALGFLGFDELPPEDTPPRHIWLDPDRLKEHFDAVKRRRKEEMNPDEAIDTPVENQAAKDLRA